VPKTTIWLVYATFADGERHILMAYVEEKDARQHADKGIRQPYDGRDVLMSAAETLGIKTVTVVPLPVW